MHVRCVAACLVVVILAAGPLSGTALAQPKGVFIPLLVYRTGPYAPSGIPVANGLADYYTLINERDGGINGIKLAWEECEFQYDTKRGVECYERLRGKGAVLVKGERDGDAVPVGLDEVATDRRDARR